MILIRFNPYTLCFNSKKLKNGKYPKILQFPSCSLKLKLEMTEKYYNKLTEKEKELMKSVSELLDNIADKDISDLTEVEELAKENAKLFET